MSKLIDFDNDYLKLVLPILLRDNTTGKNIIWATDGEGHKASDEITVDDVKNIRPRVLKRLDEQKKRTKNKAEVFTPTHICKKMNDLLEDDRRKGSWIDYITQNVLEITCGEAPYIASRYDTTTGKIIPVSERIGLLDRKLHEVSKYTEIETEWIEWACASLFTTYGYEYQGDNLLLARCNVLLDCMEHFAEKFKDKPIELDHVGIWAATISWNFWQMDGLTDCVPGTDIHSKIMDWGLGGSVEFNSLKEKTDEKKGRRNRL